MKPLLTILLFGCITASAQFTTDSIYKFGYRLMVPSSEPYQYMEYKNINWADTGTSFRNHIDTTKYKVTIIPLLANLEPTFMSNISFLDSDKKPLKKYRFKTFQDSLQVELPWHTTYIASDFNFRNDTILFYFHADQVPTRITLISGDSNELTWPILRCKRRLSAIEMEEIYHGIKLKKTSALEKCGVCKLSFEI
jgi:hypothetical protein